MEEKRKTVVTVANCVSLSGRMHTEERLNEGPRIQRKQKDENETKQKQKKTLPQRKAIQVWLWQIKTPRGYRFAPLVANQLPHMASESARARLLCAILSLALPVAFGHTTACRSPALAFSATINFAMCTSPPRPGVYVYGRA